MTYFTELRANWRFLSAASIGLASGYLLTLYITSIFVPHLLKEFGWSKAQFSLSGITIVLAVFGLPIAGRLIDVFGLRRIAMIGVVGTPLVFIALSVLNGDFRQYFWIAVVQTIFVSTTTGTNAYGRLIAQGFKRARGIALAIAGCAPPITGAAIAPLLSHFIDSHGWRAGYLAVAAGTGIGGIAALLLMPKKAKISEREVKGAVRTTRQEYRTIIRSPAFKIIIAGALFCNLTYMVQASQLGVIILDKGVTSEAVALMISAYAFSVVIGRIAAGVALDRFAPHIVISIALGLPTIGLLILASGIRFPLLLTAAVSVLGLFFGAETNIMAYLVMRFFRVEIFSSVLGLVGAAMAIAGASGSLLLSLILRSDGGYSTFLVLSAFSTVIASGVFLMLGRSSVRGTIT